MSKIHEEVLAANDAYAKQFGDKGKLALPPARRFAILTCMDARIDPARFVRDRRTPAIRREFPREISEENAGRIAEPRA